MVRKYEVKCIHCNSDLNKDWLHAMKAIFHPCVRGAIHDTINTHGPITERSVGSAAKRIVGAIVTKLHEIDSGINRTKLSIRKLTKEEQRAISVTGGTADKTGV